MYRAQRTIPFAFLTLLSLPLASATLPAPPASADSQPAKAPLAEGTVDHSLFDKLLKKYVNENGLVAYKGLKAEQAVLNQYLSALSKNPPGASVSQPEQMAYWINAYNAYTIRLILDHYPLQSIKDIGSKIQIPFVTTPWAAKFFSIGGKKMSLDEIEHGILRKKYDDPRIHFALVCASLSCPRLRREAYTAARLNQQLDEQGRDFLNDPIKNKVGKQTAQLSKYFDWYKGDWNNNGQSVAKWVNTYAATKMSGTTPVSFLPYNWQLNAQ